MSYDNDYWRRQDRRRESMRDEQRRDDRRREALREEQRRDERRREAIREEQRREERRREAIREQQRRDDHRAEDRKWEEKKQNETRDEMWKLIRKGGTALDVARVLGLSLPETTRDSSSAVPRWHAETLPESGTSRRTDDSKAIPSQLPEVTATYLGLPKIEAFPELSRPFPRLRRDLGTADLLRKRLDANQECGSFLDVERFLLSMKQDKRRRCTELIDKAKADITAGKYEDAAKTLEQAASVLRE